MATVISTVNMKGGVGKTTLTVNLATCLAKFQQKRVLVLDLDAQISATLSLMSPHEFAQLRRKKRTLSYLLEAIIKPNPYNKLTIDDIIVPSVCEIKGLDLLPGDIELYDEYVVSETLHHQAILQEDLGFDHAWNNLERVLIQKIIDPIQDRYDYIIMDCAPGYNLLTRSGLCSSHFYLLPARPEPLSIVGIQLLERRIVKLKASHQETAPINPGLLGIVFILSGGGLLSRYYNQVMRRVQQDFQSHQIFANAIPMDVNVAKAVDMFVPAVAAMPSSSGSKAFMKLTEEFLMKAKK
ncbi:MAG: ParA family protein [Microcystis sp. M_OC_Ca_00000000_S217Cul]|uniref:ParA family protein n=2 Tax=Microcystis TaxID=1125 RepID=A0A841UQS9_MICAE|nr:MULTISPECIES: ParA family protein [Microcystis]MBC1193403.1 ParA family protein [Microcystis aeruginosa BLCC-F108]MCA2590100.1 ParA family protein [Microcystis sp. M31BS1]MDB9410370.1 ParA family protein [Microcystis aeruginosa CS-558/01A06]TRT71376.1 MAG: ParA family protein [Microcystis sp. M_OC_Ca_00000000_S217Cul]TRT82857.1 MAG: ParA family protein [Microcystis sp. M_OC_Ca_00000000_C217Col]